MSSKRLIILDTETTGLDPKKGDRITEIACTELINLAPTGNFFQQYINPERELSEKAHEISGLTYEFLKNYPTFNSIIDQFLDFIKDDQIVIHNAKFDMSFLDHEFGRINYPCIEKERIIDSLILARKKFPGAPCSLDALCKRFGISLHDRNKHGARIDTELLSLVYIELMGGRQRSLQFIREEKNAFVAQKRQNYPRRTFDITQDEENLHSEFIKKSFKKTLWTNLH